MTKQDILNMENLVEVNRTLITNPELWDMDVYEHQMALRREENLRQTGDPDVYADPFKVVM